MEAMSVERMLLASWEEDGFIGRNRVPLGSADLDVLAVNYHTKTVRIGETKVREGSQRVYVVDDSSVAEMKRNERDFELWLGEGWAQWLKTLPRPWNKQGNPLVKWLLPVRQLRAIEVVFCCNLHLFLDDKNAVHSLLGRAAERHLCGNPALKQRLKTGLVVKGTVQSTLEAICEQAALVCKRIHKYKYGRRFGDSLKDIWRELHRYLGADLDRLPKDAEGKPLKTRKESFRDELRRKTVKSLLKALNIKWKDVCDLAKDGQ